MGAVGIRKGQNGYEDQNEVKFLDKSDGYKCPFDDSFPTGPSDDVSAADIF